MAASEPAARQVKGAKAPLSITIDRYGIPHIAAQSIEDAFFGQGYAAALMRLWQLDINHRRQMGRLAEAFGPDFVPFDRAARLVQFRGDLAGEWRRLDPRVEGIARAFAAGINARVREVIADPSQMPVEFRSLDIVPEFWVAEDLLRARFGGAPNIRGEVRRALLACKGALELDALVHPLEPAWPLTVPAGLDPCRVHRDDLSVYNLIAAPLPYAKARRTTSLGPEGQAIELASDIDARQGSNAWVIGPKLSSTGRPILANDPHLPFSIPSPRMITHLSAPGFNVIGAGPVWRPGVQFGHNECIAFGRTDFQIDQEDLYVLELNERGTQYRTKDGWADIERTGETLKIHANAPVTIDMAFTALGPVIAEDIAARRAIVLRAAWLAPGAVINLEYVPKVLASNWGEFRAAIRYAVWGTNYMFADVEGNIGWQSAGQVPVRPNHDGLLPVPAAGDYPWTGILPLDQMPGEFNPARGFIASANQMPFPDGWPVAERRISFEWIADDRYRRIMDVLSAQTVHSPDDSWALQLDTYSKRAEALVPLLKAVAPDPDIAADHLQLTAWDFNVAASSKPAALFEIWWTELQRLIRPVLVPAGHGALITTLHPHVVIDALAAPDARFGASPAAARDALLREALRGAGVLWRLRALPDGALPDWGTLHEVRLTHALAGRLLPEARGQSGVSGHASGGDGATVMARWWAGLNNPDASGGAMFRAVLDVGNWEAARANAGPGQGGEPGSAHYRDLYHPWLDGAAMPLSYDSKAVAAVAETLIRLEPIAP